MCKVILRILMVIFNIAIFSGGVAALVVGIPIIMDGNVLDISEKVPYYLLVGAGAGIAIIGFIGCFGACCENQRMLMLYFNIHFVAFVVEVTAAGVLKSKAEKLLSKLQVQHGLLSEEWLKNNFTLLWQIAFFVTAIEVGAMIVSFILIKKEYFKPANVSDIVDTTSRMINKIV